ncbi:MAG: bifunctional 5,10-methylenetetrahydrofolate dehydrogenase/5,10-methenyltetrahydrofolate cyclohydrolase [Candidatus Cloacimonadaceae bacterium]|nr:bifunctional 5,10-methylenetetrahydrofolate dehydrogenase/5,10-methenyltetrahydrofolate cyclohydrolase [Candidatus Cloacimonadaceae bacterium]MDP3114104.1 bifunctional 5,10-methylenetetrahydrofolate dehydrogenase/5,10-methenyltetrahydrofolate cyclohydrolase [Candidatus Cloacimonadaceae bacterium]
MEKILSGKPIASAIKTHIKTLCHELDIHPAMLLIQVGTDPASDYYVQSIVKNGEKLGLEISLTKLHVSVSQSELLAIIEAANQDPSIDGIMLQKPLPKHIDDIAAGMAIAPGKDIDSLNPGNLGKILLETDSLLPNTPAAVYATLKYYQVPVQGKHVVIIGRSSIVGKPLANMLLWKNSNANATVTVCHSKSENLSGITQSADILIAAIGKANFVSADMIKKDAILIDVGINEVFDASGKQSYVGDIDYNSCFCKALAITPVPGGIGVITSALLMYNLLKTRLIKLNQNKSIDDFLRIIFSDK